MKLIRRLIDYRMARGLWFSEYERLRDGNFNAAMAAAKADEAVKLFWGRAS